MSRFKAGRALAITLFTIVWASVALAQSDLPAPVQKARAVAVSVIAYDAGGKFLQQGSGILINKQGHVVSCLHLLHGAARIDVKTASGKTYPLTAVGAEDRENNLFAGAISISPRDVAEAAFGGAGLK